MNRFQFGLLLCALSALLNVDGVIALGQDDPPPLGVGIASAVAGLATLAGVALAARSRPGGLPLVIVTRLLSALVLGLPTYFIGAAGWVYATVTAGMVLTAAGLTLLWPARGQAAARSKAVA